MRKILAKMKARDREILTRFYLHEQPPEQIQREMGLTLTQFNLYKSRAKNRLTELVHRKLAGGSSSRPQ
jgi:DNA-directed RNA polymerase specialized sigma24 family protein